MPRPSKKLERTSEILDAVARCVARYGVAGTTLDAIAQESGLARPLIRHNLGNREDIIEAFTARYFEQSKTDNIAIEQSLVSLQSNEQLVEMLFSMQYEDNTAVVIAQALNIAAIENPKLAVRLHEWTNDLSEIICNALQKNCPEASSQSCSVIAAGLVNLYLSVASYAPLNPSPKFLQDSIDSAKVLVRSLNSA